VFFRWYASFKVPVYKMAGATCVTSQGTGEGGGNWRRQALVSGSISTCAVCFDFFAGAAHGLGGAKQNADKRSEKVRQLWAGSVWESKVLCSNSVRCVSFGFTGAVVNTFGIGQLFEVRWGGSKEERGAGDLMGAMVILCLLVSEVAEVMMAAASDSGTSR